MSTVVILLIVIAAVVVLGVTVMALRTRGAQGGRSLKRRFGPEYERTVARHDGDAKAAERELAQRVERHGGLRERTLETTEVERYEARWTAAQERFVESPKDAVDEADRLLAELAQARGYPDGAQYEEQLSALSVHHANRVHGYRRVHSAARAGAEGGSGTEELREAMVEARALFEELVAVPVERHREPHEARKKTGSHTPWSFTGRQAKGS
ncbi:hypothetical protein DMH25_34365 [Streptomyces sp. WAC 01325]|uniref:hypothetical protein n=1 Tax=Streptomyces TaxID=1883 RepID=UPI000F878AD0|nr:hypothetical protein [Streptomyces sp. WAC 01325]RSM94304.1 hypothetical protein DMH25_34365 [Streptomyces sp. WAC 01325]WCH91294.1 hypothetical protein POD33_03715 [Streptomyces moderatus]